MQQQLSAPGPLVGTGLTSDVYAWGEARVLKLFHHGIDAARVEREFSVTRIVHDAGLPAPAVYDLIERDGRLGIVFERIDGPSLADRAQSRPWTLFAVARQFADLQAALHTCPRPADLPRDHWIDRALQASEHLPEPDGQMIRTQLADPRQADVLCHGDFHPANILCTPSGPIFIDWSRATRGPALADVAMTSHLFETASLPPGTSRPFRLFFESLRRVLHRAYLKRYLQLRPGTREQIAVWKAALRSAAVPLPRKHDALHPTR